MSEDTGAYVTCIPAAMFAVVFTLLFGWWGGMSWCLMVIAIAACSVANDRATSSATDADAPPQEEAS